MTEGPEYNQNVMATTAGVAGIEPTMTPGQAITQLLQTAGIPLIPESTQVPLRVFTNRHTSGTSTVTIEGASEDEGSFYVLGGVIAAAAVLLLCITVLGLQYMFKHKGSYITNEEDDDESIEKADLELEKDAALLVAVEEE